MTQPPNQPTKFIAYFELRDACAEEGCPVCTLLVRFSVRTMDHFMYERVTDPGCREELLASRGFCNWHAWMLPKIHHSASGTAVIHEHLLKDALGAIEGLRRSHIVQSRWRRLMSCVEFIADLEFKQSLERSSGLCLPHLYLALAIEPNHPNLPDLLKLQAAKIEKLRTELLEFVRKHDYRFREEPVGCEGSAWLRSIELLAGKPGVFGPDRPWIHRTPEMYATAPDPARTKEASSEGGDELRREIDQLGFENEKLRRRIDEITKLWTEESSRAASLHFQGVRTFERQTDFGVQALRRSWRKPGMGGRDFAPP